MSYKTDKEVADAIGACPEARHLIAGLWATIEAGGETAQTVYNATVIIFSVSYRKGGKDSLQKTAEELERVFKD